MGKADSISLPAQQSFPSCLAHIFFSDIYFSPTLPTQLRVRPEESKTVVLNLGYTFVPPRKMFKNPYAKDRAQTN